MRHTALVLFCVLAAARGQEITHRFLCIDNDPKDARLIYVDQMAPARSWAVSLPDVAGRPAKGQYRDLQLLDGGKVLVNHIDGAGEYSLTDGSLVKQAVAGLTGINTARRLPNGHTILANQKHLFECDTDGNLLRAVPLPTKPKPNVRVMRLTDANTVLFPSVGPRCIVEMDMNGNLLRTVPLIPGAKGYTYKKLPNGNFLASTGALCKIVELDTTGKMVSYVGGKEEHPDARLDFCSGWVHLPNGNIVMTNWLGHGKQGTGPHLVEFTPENKLVWQWEDHDAARTVTNVLVIE